MIVQCLFIGLPLFTFTIACVILDLSLSAVQLLYTSATSR